MTDPVQRLARVQLISREISHCIDLIDRNDENIIVEPAQSKYLILVLLTMSILWRTVRCRLNSDLLVGFMDLW